MLTVNSADLKNVSTQSTCAGRWYYKNNDAELVQFGYDEALWIESNYQNYIKTGKNQIMDIDCGYFSNCLDRHCIDFLHFVQYNLDSKESRTVLRAIESTALKKTFMNVNSYTNCKAECDSDNSRNAISKHNLLKKTLMCGDINLSMDCCLTKANIINDTVFAHGKKYDIPIACVSVEAGDDSVIDGVLNAFSNNQFEMMKLYDLNIKINSSLISYLISEEKCNFIMYDTDFKLLAIAQYTGEYIHTYEKISINPYQYQSLLHFHSILGTLLTVLEKVSIQVSSLISVFNKVVRSYSGRRRIWTPQNMIVNIEELEAEDAYDSYDSASDEEECSVCYEYIIKSNLTKSELILPADNIKHYYHYHNHHKWNHKDICDDCLIKWIKSGKTTCPKCGIPHT